MKKRTNIRIHLAASALFILSVASSHAAALLVDLDHDGSATQSGWQSWDLDQNFSGVLNQSTTFSFADATDGNVDINLSTSTTAGTRDYGTNGATPGTLTNPDVYTDLWFFNNNTSGTFTVTLDDLSAGSYEFTSYHFANDLSTGNSGIADISLNGVDTGLNATLEVANPPGLTNPAADVEAGNRTISFTVANDDDTVTILYDNLDGNGGGNSFGLNGFELVAVVPEPSSIALIGVSGMLLTLRRRRS